MAETNAHKFIELFKELESAARMNYGLNDWDSVAGFLSKREEYSGIREQIKYCRDIRNILQHDIRLNGRYPIEPSDDVVNLLENILEIVRNRQKCYEIMVPRDRVFCKRLSDTVINALPAMRNAAHNHVPVIGARGKVVGVFTAVSFLRLMADKGESIREKKIRFSDIPEYTAFNHHSNEAYSFVSGDMYADELREMFEKLYSKGRKLSMVFVTSNGKPSGRLLGIITPWDILGKEKP